MLIATRLLTLKTYAEISVVSVRILTDTWRCILLVACLLLLQAESAIASSWPDISLIRLSGGLVQPVHIAKAGDDSRRLFIVEQAGRIRIIRRFAFCAIS